MAKIEKKFSKFYDNNVDKVYRFIFLKVGSPETAQDLTSQVFMKIWDKLNRSKDKSQTIKNLSAYAYQVARAEVANYYRDKERFQIIFTEESSQIESPFSEHNPERMAQIESDFERIKVSLGELSEDYQNVLILRYVNNLSFKEISEILEKPEGTIRVMLHRALKELREKLKNGEDL